MCPVQCVTYVSGRSHVHCFNPGAVKPIVEKTFPLSEVADALRYPVEGCLLGRVVLTI